MRRGLLVLLFVVSGAAALCYEVAWTRHLVLVFGNTTRAVALLLGAYMLGLALGSEVGGRLADRTRRPALWYAGFEVAIAAFALAFPWLVDVVRGVYLGLGSSATPVLFGLAFLLLVVPTFCMGTTLPLLVRATVEDPARTGRDVGVLYGANIVGAVLGAAGTGFWLMEAAGVLGATRWAAAANAAVGVVGWLAFRGTAAAQPDAAPAPAAPATDTPEASRLRRAALVSAFAAGFVGLAAQVAWTRLLTIFLQGFTWTFTAILATFLTGLALGGWVFGRAASASRDPARLLVRLHLGVAVAAALTLWMLGNHLAVTRGTWSFAGNLASDLGTRHRLALVLGSAAVMLLPSFLMGGCFPVATALYQRGLSDLGARVGRVYAVNTAGCVLGSLVAGFVLHPWLGPSMSAAWVAVGALMAAEAVARTSGARPGPVFGSVSLVACLSLLWFAAPSEPVLLRSHVFAGDRAREVELLDTLHGEVCTVSVVENTRERYRLLYTDEFEAAGTKPEYRYMRMLAHLPVALAADPSRTLVICFGTGTTSGSVATHSAVRELDIVEISPEVLEVDREFADVNRHVLTGAGRSDLTVRVHVDDGRHFVQRGGPGGDASKWGVITLEPLMPYTPAAIHFYTEDFYRECAARLAPGGLACQWIPLQGMSGEHFPRLVASFVRVFPESALFFVDGAVALIGGPDGVKLDWRRVAERLSDPRVAEDLRSIGFDDPARALATFVASGETLRKFGTVEPVTDEFPVLEFHPLPAGVVLPWLGQNVLHVAELRRSYERLPVDLTGAADAERAAEKLFVALRSGNDVLEGIVNLEESGVYARLGSNDRALVRLQDARQAYARALAIDPGNDTARRSFESLEREWRTIQGVSALERNDLAAAEKSLVRASEQRALRQADVAWTRLAEVRNRAEKFEAALEAACEATRLYPGGLLARAERAFARAALGDFEGASEDYSRALRDEPLDVLPPRLRQDAERVLAAHPRETWFAAKLTYRHVPDLRERIAEALAGKGQGRIPPRLALRILRADDPDAFDERFEDLVRGLVPRWGDSEPHRGADGLEWIAALRLAAPGIAGPSLVGCLEHDRPALFDPAAEALAELDPRLFAETLAAAKPGPAAAALARAAVRCTDRRVVRPLIRLLRADDAATRTAAHRALFSLTGGEAPGLATMDPDASTTEAYRRAIFDLEAWWAREQDAFELRR